MSTSGGSSPVAVVAPQYFRRRTDVEGVCLGFSDAGWASGDSRRLIVDAGDRAATSVTAGWCAPTSAVAQLQLGSVQWFWPRWPPLSATATGRLRSYAP